MAGWANGRSGGLAVWRSGGCLHGHGDLGAVQGGNIVAIAAAGFIGLQAADLDGGAFGRRGLPIDEPLVARGELATANADGVKLVDLFGDREQLRDRAEGLATEVHVGSRDDDAYTAVGERVDDIDDP